MERTNGAISDILEDKNRGFTKPEDECFIIQLLHAIATYQSVEGISHNDLHTGNIFYTKVDETTTFNGETLYDADYYHYSIHRGLIDLDLYLPATQYIAKIADFGFSTKWSIPIISWNWIFQQDNSESDAPWIPNWYIPQYDSSYALYSLASMGSEFAWFVLDGLDIPLELFRPYGRPIFSPINTSSETYLQNPYPTDFDLKNYPELRAQRILSDRRITGKFWKRPRSGKIVTLGSL
jgi:hypothetical protein